MNASVVRLPTAAPSYIRVRRTGRRWCIELVTPCQGGKTLATRLASSPDRATAIDHARQTGLRMQRPVRLPGERAP